MPFLEPCGNKRILKGQLVVTWLWLAITVVGIFLRPDSSGHGTHQQLGLPPCPSVLLFDKPCPGCGLTTSWTATIHGNFVQAFAAHPLGPILYLGLTVVALLNIFAYFKGYRLDTSGRRWMTGIVIGAVIFFGFGIVRFVTTDTYRSPNELQSYFKTLAERETAQTSKP